jgi:hypothetical protein
MSRNAGKHDDVLAVVIILVSQRQDRGDMHCDRLPFGDIIKRCGVEDSRTRLWKLYTLRFPQRIHLMNDTVSNFVCAGM